MSGQAELTAVEFASRLLARVSAKRLQNSEITLTLSQLETWLREILNPDYVAESFARPVHKVEVLPPMEVGKFYPGFGVWTGSGATAKGFTGENLLQQNEEK
jgi:hypothetical protein